MPWIPLAVMAVGAGAQIYGAVSGAAAQKEGMQAQQRMENLKAARERTQQVRNARAARAEIQQRGANQGAGMSSSVITGASGVSMEAAQNIQYTGYEQQTGQAMSLARQKQLNAEGVSSIGSGISEVAGTVFNNRKELFDGEDSIFGGSRIPNSINVTPRQF